MVQKRSPGTPRPREPFHHQNAEVFHMTSTRIAFIFALLTLVLPSIARAQGGGGPGTVAAPDMPDGLLSAIAAEYLTDEERRDLRVRHGVWTEQDLAHAPSRARAALIAGVYDDPVFQDDSVAAVDRAEAAFRRGEIEIALELLAGETSLRAQRLRAESLEGIGRFDEANAAIDPIINALIRSRQDNADELVEGVRAIIIRARIEGSSAGDYRRMLDLLARAHQDLDRYSWPALLTEAEFLHSKNSFGDAQTAALRALSLNPALADAWALQGRFAVGALDVNSAMRVAGRLDALERRLSPDTTRAHPMGDVIRAKMRLRERDPDDAMASLERAHSRYPAHREVLALRAAGEAARFEFILAEELLEDFDRLSPRSPLALYEVASALSEGRQYGEAEAYFERAIDRQPNWPMPHIKLGLMYMQTGEDTKAEQALDRATQLDPFNERAENSKDLIEEMLNFDTVQSEHFLVRYLPGEDEIMAREMIDDLEALHEIVSAVFDHVPERKTIIELMPNHELFAVRITGMTGIHTIAAATGPLIAMETPRQGRGHSGPYDWARVIQHEYAHTVTLSRTNNRIPHWFTEAAAVYVEPGPRDYSRCELLYRALDTGTLFDMREINIAFARPKKPTDRAQAYAQGHWMYQYIVDRWGDRAPLKMMDLYASGFNEIDAMNEILGVSVEEFQEAFVEWAREDVRAWGMIPSPSIGELRLEETLADTELRDAAIAEIGEIAASFAQRTSGLAGATTQSVELIKVTEDLVDFWLALHPEHADLLELKIGYELKRSDGEPTIAMADLLAQYARARPVDPMPHTHLAKLYLGGDAPENAIPHLEYLDIREQYKPVFAAELARQYAAQGDWENAINKATRAVRISPYDGNYRELAAAIAIQSGDLARAEHHIEALTIYEPNIPQHSTRLDAIRALRERE